MLVTASTFCKPADGGGWRSLTGLWLCHPFSMYYKTVELDGRHAWRHLYGYYISFTRDHSLVPGTGVLEFDRARRWFNQTYGWSQDVQTQDDIRIGCGGNHEDLNQLWAYSTQYRNYRIYVLSDRELSFFVLAHAGTA